MASIEMTKNQKHKSKFLHSLLDSPAGLTGALIIILVILVSIFAPIIAPYDPYKISMGVRLKPPSITPLHEGEFPHLFGTDSMGRDLFSRTIYGARVSLILGFVASVLGGAVGVFLGLISGYFGGKADSFISWMINVQLAFPFTLLAIFIIAIFGNGLDKLVIVLAWSVWVNYARIMRAQVISVKGLEYVDAAKTIGASPLRIMMKHILPNAISPLIVVASFSIASAILQEASLSFLGLGVNPTIATWGSMLSDGRSYLQTAWWIATLPGFALLLTILGANLFGDWLRDYLDPRLQIQ